MESVINHRKSQENHKRNVSLTTNHDNHTFIKVCPLYRKTLFSLFLKGKSLKKEFYIRDTLTEKSVISVTACQGRAISRDFSVMHHAFKCDSRENSCDPTNKEVQA